MFPNPHNVYLHDTSEPSLFNRVDRTFSSGCIRVGKPFALANLVLENNSRMTPDAIREAFDQSDQKTVTLLNPIPVHILYWTAWVDSEGVVQFRRDIYNRDDELIQKLQKSF
jgi:murein L,D-transpeptidase YcbB/YkuD